MLLHLDYYSTVWHSCNKTLSQSLDRSQNYAMRVILDQPPRMRSAPLRDQLHWTTLHQRRHNQMLCQVHRCLLRQAPVYLNRKFVKNSHLYSSTQGANKLHIPHPRTNMFRLKICHLIIQFHRNTQTILLSHACSTVCTFVPRTCMKTHPGRCSIPVVK